MAIQLLIGGADVTDHMRVDSLDFSDELNSRNTCGFTLIEAGGDAQLATDLGALLVTSTGAYLGLGFQPSEGQTILIQDGATKLFAGFVSEVEEEEVPGHPTALLYTIQCLDYNILCDDHRVARSYEVPTQTLYDVVSDIVTRDLAGEGVSVAGVATGPVIARAQWNYKTVAEVFNDLSEVTGYAWWIDYDKVLHFQDRSAIAAPFALTDSSANFRHLRIKTSRAQYRNRQYVRAGMDLSDPFTEDLEKGDGTKRVFATSLPVGAQPSSIVVNPGAVVKTIGIGQVETGKDFYWNKGDAQITQDNSATPLTTSQYPTLVYQGLYPVLVLQQDDTAIAARAALVGGSGVVEDLVDAPDVDGQAQASDKAGGLLRRFAHIPRTVTFETDTAGLAAGQLVPITVSKHGLTGSWLIQSIKAQDVSGKFLRYTVTALDGETIGGWETFFRSLWGRATKTLFRENEVILIFRALADAVGCGDSITYTTAAPESRADFALADFSECA